MSASDQSQVVVCDAANLSKFFAGLQFTCLNRRKMCRRIEPGFISVPPSEQSNGLPPLKPKAIKKATRFGPMSLAGLRYCDRRIGSRSDGQRNGRKGPRLAA